MLNFLKRKRKQDSKQVACQGGMLAIDQIGLAAGEVWGYLADQGPLEMERLVKQSVRSRNEVLLALGWLAREGKINLDGVVVSLVSSDCVRAA